MEKTDNVLINSELEKLIDSLNSSQNMRIQLATFFGTSNFAFLGYGLSVGKVSIIVLAAILLLFFIFADGFILRGLYGFYIRAIRILSVKNHIKDETIFDMFRLFIVDRDKKRKEIKRISELPDKDDRFIAIRKLPLRMPTVLGFWMPLIISLLELSGALYLHFIKDWAF